MIRIQLVHEGRIVKQISSSIHESVVLEQVKRYRDPIDAIIIVEGEFSEDAKSMLKHVAKKIIPAALAAGIAMSGAGTAQAQGGRNPHYPGLDRSIGQHLSDIFSPNYRERVRQRDFEQETQRRQWNAGAQADRRARVDAARQAAGEPARVGVHSSVKMYDQAKVSQDGKSYILYDMEHRVTKIPMQGTEFIDGDSQRLSHYITRGGTVYYVRHPATAVHQSQFSEEIGTVGTIAASGAAGKTQFAKTSGTTDVKFNSNGQLELDELDPKAIEALKLDPKAIEALKKAGVKIGESYSSSELAAIFDANPEAVKAFKAGEDLSDYPDFFDALYEYYFDEMPYGVKKARDGDPYEWVANRLADEFDLHQPMEARDDDDDEEEDATATAADRDKADKNIIMQIKKAADNEKNTVLNLSNGTVKIDSLLAKKILKLFDGIRSQSKELMQNMLNTKEGFAKILGHVNEQEVKESMADVDTIANDMKKILEINQQAKLRARNIIEVAQQQAFQETEYPSVENALERANNGVVRS